MRWLLIAALSVVSVAAHAEGVEWPGGARVAVSLSYDDALESQLENAVPALDELGFKASFYLTLAYPPFTARLNDWRAIAANGHELANHTVYHGCDGSLPDRDWVAPHLDLTQRSVAELAEEVRIANMVLKAIDGRNERTFTTPCGDELAGGENYIDAVASQFVAVKGRDEGMPENNTAFLAPVELTADELIAFVKQNTQNGMLLHILFHGVGGDYLAVSAEAHRGLLEFLATNGDTYWVDTYMNIMKHVQAQQ